jgi:hypothetical protein
MPFVNTFGNIRKANDSAGTDRDIGGVTAGTSYAVVFATQKWAVTAHD